MFGRGAGMTLRIDAPLRAGGVDIDPGDYDVSVDEEASTVILHRDGAEVLRAEASSRSSKVMVRKPKVELREVAAEPRRLLVARTPPAREWVLSLDERV
jgi:hypothetical protein